MTYLLVKDASRSDGEEFYLVLGSVIIFREAARNKKWTDVWVGNPIKFFTIDMPMTQFRSYIRRAK
jgi:hypothetical protein